MRTLFLMLLLLCWGLPVYAGGPIGDLTLDNIEEKLVYQNILNRGNWVPQVVKEEPAATWFSLNATTTFVAGHGSRQTRLNRIHFFVTPNKAEPDLKKRADLYMDDILLAALTTAGLCIPKFDRDKQQVQAFLNTVTLRNTSIINGEKAVFKTGKYVFQAMIVDDIYMVFAEYDS